MSKQEMIEAIRRQNRTVTEDYLGDFDEPALQEYLERLTTVHGRRGRNSIWVRRTHERAIVTRHRKRGNGHV